MDDNTYLTPFDEATSTKELQILKTLLPYVSLDRQRQLVLIIELIQMTNTLKYIDDAGTMLKSQSLPKEGDNRTLMLSAIRKFLSPSEQDTVDNLINILSIIDAAV